MRNNEQNQRGGRNNSSVIHNSIRTFSTYFKAVSSGASTVVKSAASVASSAIAERDNDNTNDQVVGMFDSYYCFYVLFFLFVIFVKFIKASEVILPAVC